MLKLSTEPPQEPRTSVSDFPKPINPAPALSIVLDGFLRREELARQLGVSPRTVDRWQALRRGPPRVHVGRTILYDVKAVREWLRSQEEQTSITRKRHIRTRKNVG